MGKGVNQDESREAEESRKEKEMSKKKNKVEKKEVVKESLRRQDAWRTAMHRNPLSLIGFNWTERDSMEVSRHIIVVIPKIKGTY